jgi:hypothetical protein
MKRAILAVTLAAIVGAGVYGLAASLNVTSGTLGAGTATVAACQAGTINVTYTSAYSASAPGYQATQVTLNGLDTSAGACGGKAFKVTLTDSADAVLGTEATGTIPSSGTTASSTFTGVAASAVEGVHVTIAG